MKQSYIYAFNNLRFPLHEGGNSVNIYGNICWIFNIHNYYYTYYKGEQVILNYNPI